MHWDWNGDKPREECGVFAVYGREEAARVAFFGLFALQHRGQESAGIASADSCQVWAHKRDFGVRVKPGMTEKAVFQMSPRVLKS